MRCLVLVTSTLLLAAAAVAQPATADASASKKLSMDIFFGNRKTEAQFKVARWGPRGIPSPAYAFRAEKIVTLEGEPIHQGIILTKNAKIVAIGKASEVEVPQEYQPEQSEPEPGRTIRAAHDRRNGIRVPVLHRGRAEAIRGR